MHAKDKFKTDIYHLAARHHNKLIGIFYLAERIDTTRRLATIECAIVLRKLPADLLLHEISSLSLYDPVGNIYAADVRGIKMSLLRVADADFSAQVQNPYFFNLYSTHRN